MKRAISLLLVLLTAAAVLASCGAAASSGAPSETAEQTASAADAADGSAAETEPADDYVYQQYDGYAFRIFAPVCGIGCNEAVDFEEQTGEALSDAIYLRNRTIEDKMNIKISAVTADGAAVWGTSQAEVCTTFLESVLAGDDEWDCAYLPVGHSPSIAQQGVFMDLMEMENLNLDEEWWDSVLNDSLTVNGKLTMASSPLQLMTLDSTWLLLFNKDMMDDLGIDYPYDAVRSGKWTLDAWQELTSAGTSLNGDDGYKFDENGKCVYGVGAHSRAPYYLINASGCMATDASGDGLTLTLGSERFYAAADKIASIFRESDGFVHVQNGNVGNPGGYEDLFFNNRALFLTCEIKSTLNLRAMDAEYGLLPFPKLDETQEDYRTAVTHNADLLVVPVTVEDTARTGAVLDALSCESCGDVLSAYFDTTICQKGLRDEDSIEMLGIVRAGRTIEVSLVFGITTDFVNSFNTYITQEKDGVSSLVATYEEKAGKALDALVESLS